MTDCAFELIAASRITEPHNMTVIFRERICLHWLAGPRAGFIDTIGDIERAHRAFLNPHELKYTAVVGLSQFQVNQEPGLAGPADALLYQLDIPHLSGIATSQLTSDYTRIPTTTVLITGSKIIEQFPQNLVVVDNLGGLTARM